MLDFMEYDAYPRSVTLSRRSLNTKSNLSTKILCFLDLTRRGI